jgi:hypothetical protein
MADADDDRLLACIAAARERFGDAVLTDPGRLAPVLGDMAPELRGRIRGVVAALAAQAPAQIRAAADMAAATQAWAAHLAAQAGMEPAQAAAGLVLALRVPPVAGAAAAPPPAGPAAAPPAEPPLARSEWVGQSVPVAAAAPAASGPADPLAGLRSLVRNKYVLAGAAALAVLYFVQSNQKPDPAADPHPGPPPRSTPGPQAGGLPMLSTDLSSPPGIPVHTGQDGTELAFAVPIPNGALQGVVLLGQGWQGARVGFGRPGADHAGTISAPADFALSRSTSGTLRLLRPHWLRDEVSAGEICVVFGQPGGADVQLHGSRMCLLEFANNDCSRIIGCGTVE